MAQSMIILGASARAAAQSAIRAGYQPWCADLFADRDLRAIATVRTCPIDQYPVGLLRLLEDAPPGPVLVTGAMENHPQVLDGIALRRKLLGSSPAAVRAARDPGVLASMPAAAGLRLPKLHRSATLWARVGQTLAAVGVGRGYLVKPLRGAAGAGVARWNGLLGPASGHYLQEYVAGEPVSAVFVADGWSARLLGATRQIVGDPAFGAREFRYVGNVGPLPLDERPRKALMHLGAALSQRCDLRGVFGVDFILDHRGNLWPTEVNPRYPASVEVIERATGIAALAEGAAARMPDAGAAQCGKAIVYARRDIVATDLYGLFREDQVADVPDVGQAIAAGKPICTLLAQAPDHHGCLAKLRQMAGALYTRLEA